MAQQIEPLESRRLLANELLTWAAGLVVGDFGGSRGGIFVSRANGTDMRQITAEVADQAITIVLPVYNAFEVLPEVLDRVVRHTDLPWRLILIEDASTDPGIRPFLRQWVADQQLAFPGRIALIENKENQGFIRSVNAGLKRALAYSDHVVLLNSDALVPKAWASRLMRPFIAHDRVATVTPMSNDAEIFSAQAIGWIGAPCGWDAGRSRPC